MSRQQVLNGRQGQMTAQYSALVQSVCLQGCRWCKLYLCAAQVYASKGMLMQRVALTSLVELVMLFTRQVSLCVMMYGMCTWYTYLPVGLDALHLIRSCNDAKGTSRQEILACFKYNVVIRVLQDLDHSRWCRDNFFWNSYVLCLSIKQVVVYKPFLWFRHLRVYIPS